MFEMGKGFDNEQFLFSQDVFDADQFKRGYTFLQLSRRQKSFTTSKHDI